MRVELALEELEALTSALTRMKFEDAEPPEPYFGSPLLASSHRRFLDSLIEESTRSGDVGRARRWEKWRRWEARGYERQVVLRYASSLPTWRTWDEAEKMEALRIYCSPFLPDQEELSELRRDIDLAFHRSSGGEDAAND